MKAIAIVLSLMTVLAFGALSAYAQGPAEVRKDISCGIGLPGPPPSAVFTTESHAVFANDKNGNSKLTCHGKLSDAIPPLNPPEKTEHLNFDNTGYICFTSFGSTYDWSAVVTPSGNVKLTCHINPSSPPYP